jgi:hypothetical protein
MRKNYAAKRLKKSVRFYLTTTNRLLERTKEESDSEPESSDVGYYEKLEKECFGEVAVK